MHTVSYTCTVDSSSVSGKMTVLTTLVGHACLHRKHMSKQFAIHALFSMDSGVAFRAFESTRGRKSLQASVYHVH